MMKVDLLEIEKIFDELIKEKMLPEEASNWARARLFAYDNGDLEYQPARDKNKIFRSIKYLVGVDLKDVDGSYLHSVFNFIEFAKENSLIWNK